MFILLIKTRLQFILNSIRPGRSSKNRRRFVGYLGLLILPLLFFNSLHTLFDTWLRHPDFGAIFMQNFITTTFSGIFLFLLISGVSLSLHYNYLSKDLPFLRGLPITISTIARLKLVELTISNSMVFWIFGIPLLLAMALALRASLFNALVMLISSIAFVLIPSALASLLSMLIVKSIPVKRAKNISALVTAVIFVAVWLGAQLFRLSRLDPSSQEFDPQAKQWLPLKFNSDSMGWFPWDWFVRAIDGSFTGQWAQMSIGVILLVLVTWLLFEFVAVAFARIDSQDIFQYRSPRIVASKATDSAGGFIRGVVGTVIQRDFKLITRDTRQLTQYLLYIVLMMAFPFLSSPGDLALEGYWASFQPYLILVLFSALISAWLSSRSISFEGLAFRNHLIAPQPLWRLIFAKGLFTFIFIFSMITLSSGIAMIYFQTTSKSFGIAWTTMVGMSVGVIGIGLAVGAAFAKFDWDNPKHMLRGSGTLILNLVTLLFVATGVFVIYLTTQFDIPWFGLFILLLVSLVIFYLGTTFAAKRLEGLEWIY